MTNMEHLQDNIRTYSPLVPLTEEETQYLYDTADMMMEYPTIPCNDCKYCMPCPYGIDIPAILIHYNKFVNTMQFFGNINRLRAMRRTLVAPGTMVGLPQFGYTSVISYEKSTACFPIILILAALMVLGGFKTVYADIISTPALALLCEAGIETTFAQEVPHIINRDKTGWCPLETACMELNTVEEMYPVIQNFISRIRAK